jgi:hypothetical protein
LKTLESSLSGLPSIGFAALTAMESESKKGPASNEKVNVETF